MDIKVQKTDFLKAVSLTAGAVSSKGAVPVLNNILLQANKEMEQIVLTGTDLEIGIRTNCQAQVILEGSITIPAKKLFDIVRELPEGEIDIAVTKNNAVNIKAKKAYFKIMGLGAEDFPKLPEPTPNQTFELDQAILKHCLGLTSFAISHDETRYTLNGVLIALKNGMARFVATDGKRLAFVEKKVDLLKDISIDAIIPAKTVLELLKNLPGQGKVKVMYSQNQILFQLEGTTIVSRLIEGKFPNYEQVIPKETKTNTQLNRQDFLSAIKRISLLTSQENQTVKLDFTKGRVLVSSRSPNLGEAKEELEAEVLGEDLAIGFNPNYLTDILKNLDVDQISLSLTGPDKPGLFKKNDEYLYVVMPMQLTY